MPSPKPPPPNSPPLKPAQPAELEKGTLGHYESDAANFWEGTRDHDVSQNIDALLECLPAHEGLHILDFGCGPGRDLLRFRELGHEPVGLDGTAAFVEMGQRYAGCEVLHQSFLALDLEDERFDGIFANASLFHVPRQELPRVLRELWSALVPSGVLFCSNPRGQNKEGWMGERYGCAHDLATWSDFLEAAGFEEIRHYYRPKGKPRAEQPWLASLWRKPA